MADQEKQLDQLLDSLLADYSDIEPRPGLETRLLANLRANALPAEPSGRRIWRWVVAGTGASVLAVVLLVIYSLRIPNPLELPKIQVADTPSAPAIPVFDVPRLPQKKWRMQQSKTPGPVAAAGFRQEVFPTPSPLSQQEKLLLRYLTVTPQDEVVAHSHSDEPAETIEPPGPRSQQLNGTEEQGTR